MLSDIAIGRNIKRIYNLTKLKKTVNRNRNRYKSKQYSKGYLRKYHRDLLSVFKFICPSL